MLVSLALACLSGVLLVLSCPPLKAGALAWIALVPLLVVIDGRRPGAALALAYLGGLVFFAGSFYWIWWVPAYNLVDEALLGFYLVPLHRRVGMGVAWVRARTVIPLAWWRRRSGWPSSTFARTSASLASPGCCWDTRNTSASP